MKESGTEVSSSTTGGTKAALFGYISLLTLTIQNATQTLVLRYVRTRGGDMFFSTTAVCMSEVIKCLSCLCIIFAQEKFSLRRWLDHLSVNIFQEPIDCIKISVPGFLYVIQNNLLYVAASNLEAAKYQVAYQLKLLTTALFSVVMLRKHLGRLQWLSLLILTVGVALVQLPSSSQERPTPGKINSDLENQSSMIGFTAVLTACVISGFSGVYFEKLLKNTPQSVHVRNVQLGFLGTVLGLVVCYFKDGDAIGEKGFLFGYNFMVWVAVLLLALGGLIVAMVVKYADNILKGFATSGSIILACFVSMALFDFQPTVVFYVGMVLVMISVYMYSRFVPSESSLLPLFASTSKPGSDVPDRIDSPRAERQKTRLTKNQI